MTLAAGIFLFVSVVTLTVTGGIAVMMLRDARRGLEVLEHQEPALPQVMAGRYLFFFTLTALAVWHGDFLVMAGLQAAFVVASLADVVIYARRGARIRSHLMAGFAAAIAAGLCGYVVLTG